MKARLYALGELVDLDRTQDVLTPPSFLLNFAYVAPTRRGKPSCKFKQIVNATFSRACAKSWIRR